jgi:hypothetical protein
VFLLQRTLSMLDKMSLEKMDSLQKVLREAIVESGVSDDVMSRLTGLVVTKHDEAKPKNITSVLLTD